MNRTLSAACAALLLAGSLTACGTTTNTAAPNNQTDGVNDPNGTPSGTSYVAPRTHYPNGADQDRESYNRMTSSRRSVGTNNTPRSDGLYTAYSDGYVYPGSDVLSPDSGPGIVHDAARTARDMVSGAGTMIRDAGNAIRNTVGGVNDTRKATAGESNMSQRMGNNVDNTMRNVNAE